MITESITAWHSVLPVFLPTALTLAAVGRRISQLAYGIEQIAVEDEGKEPSAKHIADIIEQASTKGVKCLLYQKEYPQSVVEVLAEDTDLRPQEINPLTDNPIEFIVNWIKENI